MDPKTIQIVIAFTFGVIFFVALIAWSILHPTPFPAQYAVFRTVLALAAAGVAAMVPGFINIELDTTTGLLVRAAGALAVFVIVFFFKPASLELQPTPAQPAVEDTAGKTTLENINANPVLQPVWDRLDVHLQDAFALAAAQARRVGQQYVSTRTLFAALRRLNVEPLQDLFQQLPDEALPLPIDSSVQKDIRTIDSQLGFSACVRDSLNKLSPQVSIGKTVTSEDMFVDIAKNGRGESVGRLRSHGIDAARIDQIVTQLG